MQDFGYQRFQGSIGDTVYQDVNENAHPGPRRARHRRRDGAALPLRWADANGDGLFDERRGACPAALAHGDHDGRRPAHRGGRGRQVPLLQPRPRPRPGQYYLVRGRDQRPSRALPTLTADPDTDGVPCTVCPTRTSPATSTRRQRLRQPQLVAGFAAGHQLPRRRLRLPRHGRRLRHDRRPPLGRHRRRRDGRLRRAGHPARHRLSSTPAAPGFDWTDGNGNGAWDAGEGERWARPTPTATTSSPASRTARTTCGSSTTRRATGPPASRPPRPTRRAPPALRQQRRR